MANVISVSLAHEHVKFLKESGMSPSKILQDAIDFMVYQSLEHKHLSTAVESLRMKLQRAHTFISSKQLGEEYASQVLK